MQPTRYFISILEELIKPDHDLFTPQDLRALLPNLSASAFKTLLSRAVKKGDLIRICKGLYLFHKMLPSSGLLLFHAAARLRANEFNYISLETVLSDAGIISQQPINWITIMSSGRSNKIVCNKWGTIEFIHTNQKPSALLNKLHYDAPCKLWRASVPQALHDMRSTKRDMDLIDWELAHDYI